MHDEQGERICCNWQNKENGAGGMDAVDGTIQGWHVWSNEKKD